MTLAAIPEQAEVRQGQLVSNPAAIDPAGHPGERSRPPDDAAATCHAVTGPTIPAARTGPAVTAAVAAPTAASTSAHGFRHRRVHPGQPGQHREMDPDRLEPGAAPPQPAAHRAHHQCAQPYRDPAAAQAGHTCRQRRTDQLDGVRRTGPARPGSPASQHPSVRRWNTAGQVAGLSSAGSWEVPTAGIAGVRAAVSRKARSSRTSMGLVR